jgi:hypothetical protein
MLKKINFMALGYPYFKKLQSYNRLPGLMRKSVSEQQQLLLETSMHSILQSFQIHLGVAFSYTGKTKMAWRVVSMLIIQVNLNLYSTTVSQLLNEVSSVIGARTLLKVDMVYTPVAIKYYWIRSFPLLTTVKDNVMKFQGHGKKSIDIWYQG